MTLVRDRITVQEIRQLLTSSGRADPAVERTSALLDELPDEKDFVIDEVDSERIAAIYRGRLRRIPEGQPSPVLGDREFVDELERLGHVMLAMITIEVEGWLVVLWADDALEYIVGCTVGRDARYRKTR